MALVAGLVAVCAGSADAAGGGRPPKVVGMQGKLIQKKVVVEVRSLLPDTGGPGRAGRPMTIPIFSQEWALQAADGKTTSLVLDGSRAMWKKACDLRDTSVLVTG